MDLLKDLLGVDVPEDQLQSLLDTYEDIFGEIMKLRSLDLTEVHPAVIFDPLLVYRMDEI